MMHSADTYRGTALGRHRAPAFTLVELLVVVAIIALLISVLLPALGGARYRARVIENMNNQRQIVLAWNGYSNDFDEQLALNCATNWAPSAEDGQSGRDYPWTVLLYPYVGESEGTFIGPFLPPDEQPRPAAEFTDIWEYFGQAPSQGRPVSYEMKIDLGSTSYSPPIRAAGLDQFFAYYNPAQKLGTPSGNRLTPLQRRTQLRFPSQTMVVADRFYWQNRGGEKALRQIIMADGHFEETTDIARTDPAAQTGTESEYFTDYFYFDSLRGGTDGTQPNAP